MVVHLLVWSAIGLFLVLAVLNNQAKHKYDDGFVVIEYNFKTKTWSSETYDAKRLYKLDNAQSYKE